MLLVLRVQRHPSSHTRHSAFRRPLAVSRIASPFARTLPPRGFFKPGIWQTLRITLRYIGVPRRKLRSTCSLALQYRRSQEEGKYAVQPQRYGSVDWKRLLLPSIPFARPALSFSRIPSAPHVIPRGASSFLQNGRQYTERETSRVVKASHPIIRNEKAGHHREMNLRGKWWQSTMEGFIDQTAGEHAHTIV